MNRVVAKFEPILLMAAHCLECASVMALVYAPVLGVADGVLAPAVVAPLNGFIQIRVLVVVG